MQSNEKTPNVARIFSGPEDRTAYFRNYVRRKRAAPIPKDRTCPLCKRFYMEREYWRKMEQWVCKFCAVPKPTKNCRYRITAADLIPLYAHKAISVGKMADILNISYKTLENIEKAPEYLITPTTYLKMQRNFDLQLTPTIVKELPDLKKLREEVGWTKEICAEFLGVTYHQYVAIERGTSKKDPQVLVDELLFLREQTEDQEI